MEKCSSNILKVNWGLNLKKSFGAAIETPKIFSIKDQIFHSRQVERLLDFSEGGEYNLKILFIFLVLKIISF